MLARYSQALVILFYLLPSFAFADFSGRVVGISDGDTIKVMHNGKAEKIRLNGIDCPEKGQAFGTKAKQFTSSLAFGKEVTVQVKDTDKYDRTVADVVLPDGRILNRELVEAGLAWWYQRHSKDKSLGQLEEDARAARRGLWVDPDPVPPWCWRKQQNGQACIPAARDLPKLTNDPDALFRKPRHPLIDLIGGGNPPVARREPVGGKIVPPNPRIERLVRATKILTNLPDADQK